MRAGALYYRIAFYAKVITRDSYSASVDTYPLVTLRTRGEVRESGGGKEMANEERFYSKNKELTVRYNSAIIDTMKVQIDGTDDRYWITYIETIGRKEGMRLSLEKEND